MNRKGQTWRHRRRGIVFTVLRSHPPTAARRHWIHSVLFLENDMSPNVVGSKQELQEEESGLVFEKHLKRIV